MSTIRNSSLRTPVHTRKTWIMISFFIVITIAGLTYVKWAPYYHKAMSAADTHSIGSSILNGFHADDTVSVWQSAATYAMTYFKAVWKAALLGMIVGSMIQMLLPANWLLKLLGRASFKSTLIGGASSLPGMMCSCCAAPIASGMRKQQVSVGASLAFWMGNPLLNPATLIFMTFVLSWKFTILRLVFGIVITFGISYLANRFAKPDNKTDELISNHLPSVEADNRPLWSRWITSFGRMLIQVIPAYLISVFILGILQSFMFPEWLNAGFAAIIFFAIAGTFFVIPTAAEIPIIQSFLSFGISSGASAALLITLPAISLPSLLLVSRAFPQKVLVFVTSSVIVLGIICGCVGVLWL
ncbi:permease [Paenibacillus sepulcri]|uniref:Permease n=1 Tax=Paenibacillus sepulcri TaxID=359917 RepID=A0ABS7BWZ1_9BACL|nr:permease [Paenibacillus sepulcri]